MPLPGITPQTGPDAGITRPNMHAPAGDMSGAIREAVAALANAFAPRSLVQRKQKVDQDVAEATGTNNTQNTLGGQF